MKGGIALPNKVNASKSIQVMKKKKKYNQDEVITAYTWLIPSLILLLLFIVIPLILSIYFSFFDINYYKGNVFVGFEITKKF